MEKFIIADNRSKDSSQNGTASRILPACFSDHCFIMRYPTNGAADQRCKETRTSADQFVGKPFSVLLDQIRPTIKMAYGTPDDTIGRTARIIILHFLDNEGLSARTRMKEKPTRIGVYVKPKEGRKYPSLVATAPWTEEQEMAYGDMTVLKVWVLGKN